MPSEWLSTLASGEGSSEITRFFWETERSRRFLLVRTLMETIEKDDSLTEHLPPVSAVRDVLKAAWHAAPEAVNALLLDPGVGGGCAYALRRLRGGARSGAPLWRDLATLYSFALLAAARAGLSWSTPLPARDGAVMLVTLGLARLPGPASHTFVEASTEGGRIRLTAGDHELLVPDDETDIEPDGAGIGWWALRRVTVGGDLPLTVCLDDLDPFRDLADPVAAARLDAEAFSRWSELLTEAWELLCRDHRSSAEAMVDGFVTLAPLKHEQGWDTRSASNGEAFGSVMVSEPPDAVTLAVSLVHEYQHITLGGLLHLLQLTTADDGTLYYAPWRDDPRPLPGLVQGVYAFYGIARFWQERARATTGADAQHAQFEFAYAHRQMQDSLRQALAAPGLTEQGRHFFTMLRDSMTKWTGEPVDPAIAGLATLTADSHQIGWRLRHFHPEPREVEALAQGWLTAQASAPTVPGPARLAVHPSLRWNQRMPAVTRRSVTAEGRGAPKPPGDQVSAGENALVQGDSAAARSAFLSWFGAQPGVPAGLGAPADDEARAWVGLALSSADTPAAGVLAHRPDLVRAVCAELRAAGHTPPPPDVATWLAPVVDRR
ncbi:HEXXH motif domain-containing protein [Actinoplanes sp. GCM10030250]|uniref:HEXXH motif domain-containing protein n=1 Tax=Actinoplanes sp. GCM10030250 TaxID=3273376 RepID=UPI0036127502